MKTASLAISFLLCLVAAVATAQSYSVADLGSLGGTTTARSRLSAHSDRRIASFL